MSLCLDTTPSSSAAMPEQSADVSSTPLHAHAVSWVSTSSTTCRMYSTEQPLCLPVQTPKHTEISSQTDGRKNSRATHPAFFLSPIRNRGDAYHFRAFRAQNRGFCALFAFGTPVLRHFEHKIGIFVRFYPPEPPFSGFSSTKSAFLCSSRGISGIGKRKSGLPANHRAGFQNANTS